MRFGFDVKQYPAMSIFAFYVDIKYVCIGVYTHFIYVCVYIYINTHL